MDANSGEVLEEIEESKAFYEVHDGEKGLTRAGRMSLSQEMRLSGSPIDYVRLDQGH